MIGLFASIDLWTARRAARSCSDDAARHMPRVRGRRAAEESTCGVYSVCDGFRVFYVHDSPESVCERERERERERDSKRERDMVN